MVFFKRPGKDEADTLILYGTKTGNSELIAKQLQKKLNAQGRKVGCKNMSSFSPEKLITIKNLLIVVSTHGEGAPPPPARKFFKALFAEEMIRLPNLSYAVCALGDSSYKKFCEAGKSIDTCLTQLGAIPFYDRKDCDVEFTESAIAWLQQIVRLLEDKEKAM